MRTSLVITLISIHLLGIIGWTGSMIATEWHAESTAANFANIFIFASFALIARWMEQRFHLIEFLGGKFLGWMNKSWQLLSALVLIGLGFMHISWLDVQKYHAWSNDAVFGSFVITGMTLCLYSASRLFGEFYRWANQVWQTLRLR